MKQSASLIYFVPMILFGLLFHKKGMTSGTLETEKGGGGRELVSCCFCFLGL